MRTLRAVVSRCRGAEKNEDSGAVVRGIIGEHASKEKGGCAVSEEIQVRGVIRGLEATSLQYGTHGLYTEDGELLYALRSEAVRLDDYAERPVHVYGTPDPDYAGETAEGSPDLLNVTGVHEL